MKFTQHNIMPNLNTLIDDVLGSETFETVKRNLMNQVPLANIYENDTSHIIELAVPGLNKKDIKIELLENKLIISAEVKKETKENEKSVRKEFSYQTFKRSFNLPKLVDMEKIEAKNENGLLTVSIPKKEEEIKKNKLITIK